MIVDYFVDRCRLIFLGFVCMGLLSICSQAQVDTVRLRQEYSLKKANWKATRGRARAKVMVGSLFSVGFFFVNFDEPFKDYFSEVPFVLGNVGAFALTDGIITGIKAGKQRREVRSFESKWKNTLDGPIMFEPFNSSYVDELYTNEDYLIARIEDSLYQLSPFNEKVGFSTGINTGNYVKSKTNFWSDPLSAWLDIKSQALFMNNEVNKAISCQLYYLYGQKRLIRNLSGQLELGESSSLAYFEARERYLQNIIFLAEMYAKQGKINESLIIYNEAFKLLKQNWKEGIYSIVSPHLLFDSAYKLINAFESLYYDDKAEDVYLFCRSLPKGFYNNWMFNHDRLNISYANFLIKDDLRKDDAIQIFKQLEPKYADYIEHKSFEGGVIDYLELKLQILYGQKTYFEASRFLNHVANRANISLTEVKNRSYLVRPKLSQFLLINKATVCLLEKKPMEALQYLNEYDRLIKLSSERYYSDESVVLSLLRAEVFSNTNQVELARKFYLLAISQYYELEQSGTKTLNEADRLKFISNFRKLEGSFKQFCIVNKDSFPELIEDLIDFQLRNKGKIGSASAELARRIYNSNDPALQLLFEEWQRKKDRLANLKAKLPQSDLSLSLLKEEVDELERGIYAKSYLKQISYTLQDVSWKSVATSLKRNEVAIDILRLPSEEIVDYYAIIIHNDSVKLPRIIKLKNGNELEGRYAKYYFNAIKQQIKDNISFQNYWEPIHRTLTNEKIDKVYLAPDGVFHQINISTLFNSLNNNYVLDFFAIKVLTNLISIAQNSSTNSVITTAVLLGNPDFNKDLGITVKTIIQNRSDALTDTTQRFFSGNDIIELPGTKAELKQLEEIGELAHLSLEKYSEESATEENLKRIISPDILHIATHGFFLNRQQTSSGVLTWFTRAGIDSNPFFRSGLLLAGSKAAFTGGTEKFNKGDDGILSAYEASTLKLNATSLVVLSACETGLGQIINGEGVYGLQRAFQMAGAKSVLISLWSVSDNATMELMTEFYQNLLIKKLSKSEALKQAQLVLKRKYQHPFYWGAFVLKE